ncbi:unnamed protein product [Symbiodinium sp. CCMP2592]|nr:unnamed protein product [Symbiodinium sp. CCMP2592]
MTFSDCFLAPMQIRIADLIEERLPADGAHAAYSQSHQGNRSIHEQLFPLLMECFEESVSSKLFRFAISRGYGGYDHDYALAGESLKGWSSDEEGATMGAVPAFLEAQALPSKGSVQHGTGLCKPCAWFWKLQGCKNGADCLHCHLCPETEVKDRKRRKAPKGFRLQPPPGLESPSLSGSQSGSQSDTDCEMQRRVLEEPGLRTGPELPPLPPMPTGRGAVPTIETQIKNSLKVPYRELQAISMRS